MKKFFVVIIIASLLLGCQKHQEENRKETITGTVENIRITATVQQKIQGKGDPVGGAIAGALFFGTVGAVAGAASEIKDGQVIAVSEIKGCQFFVRADGHLLSFSDIGNNSPCIRCSLMRSGDRIKIKKTTDGDGVRYDWMVEEALATQAIRGEIVP